MYDRYHLALFHETIDGVPLEEPLYIEYLFARPGCAEERAYALDRIFNKLCEEAKQREFKKGGMEERQ